MLILDLLEASKDGIEFTQAPNLTSDHERVEEPAVQSVEHESISQSAQAGNQIDNNRESNIKLENKLLRKEITSLNEEMVSQLQRVKEAEKSKINFNMPLLQNNFSENS